MLIKTIICNILRLYVRYFPVRKGKVPLLGLFERLGVFTYSHEENTHAHTLADDIAQEEKQRRSDAIMEAQMGISEAFNQQLKGQTLKVLFDRLEGDEFVGRTEYDSPEVDNEVRVSAKDNYVRMGDFAQVKITDASAYDLMGEVVTS